MTALLLALSLCLFNATVFVDADADGQHGIVDRPLAGASVVLTFADGSVHLTTDEQGNVSYSGQCAAAKWTWPHGVKQATRDGLGIPDALPVAPFTLFIPNVRRETK